MLSQDKFDEIELEYGCGYWYLCAERACPCAITTENKGLQESIYNGFIEENRKLAEEYENDCLEYDYEPLVPCNQCSNLEYESDLILGMCSSCYDSDDEEYCDYEE